MFWTPEKRFLNDPFETESQLDAAIAASRRCTDDFSQSLLHRAFSGEI